MCTEQDKKRFPRECLPLFPFFAIFLTVMEFVLATNNPHKKEEFDSILAPHTILLPGDLGVDFSFDETGVTYFENAYGKAAHLFSVIHRPVLADDSGLSVVCLDGAPGIYSARFGGGGQHDKLPAEERNRYLLDKLGEEDDRSAFFVCCLVLILTPYRFYTVQETLDGELAAGPAGTGGFGYDPIFYLPGRGKTVAQLPDSEKNSLSHRGKAGHKMARLIG
jgi:XTP/dITP diphosphohydrolase